MNLNGNQKPNRQNQNKNPKFQIPNSSSLCNCVRAPQCSSQAQRQDSTPDTQQSIDALNLIHTQPNITAAVSSICVHRCCSSSRSLSCCQFRLGAPLSISIQLLQSLACCLLFHSLSSAAQSNDIQIVFVIW